MDYFTQGVKRARETFELYGETAEDIAVAFGAPALAIRASTKFRRFLGGAPKRRRRGGVKRAPRSGRKFARNGAPGRRGRRRGTTLRYTGKRTTRVYKKKRVTRKSYKRKVKRWKKVRGKWTKV